MKRHLAAILVLGIPLLTTDVHAEDPEENNIRRAFLEFQVSLVPITPTMMVAKEKRQKWIGAEASPALREYLIRIAAMAYGNEPFDGVTASYLEAFGVYVTRFSNICPYLVSADQSKPFPLADGLAGALELLPSPGTVVIAWNKANEEITSIQRDGDIAWVGYRWTSIPVAAPGDQTPKAVTFTDKLEIRRENGDWQVVFPSYRDMIDRHWIEIVAGTFPSGGKLLTNQDAITPEQRKQIAMTTGYVLSPLMWSLSFDLNCMNARRQRAERLRAEGASNIAGPAPEVIVETPIREWGKILN